MNTSLVKVMLLLLVLFSVGCSTAPKHSIIYTNDSVVKWKDAKLRECHEQSVLITLTTYDVRVQSGEVMTEEQVVELQKWLMWQCLSYYKLDI